MLKINHEKLNACGLTRADDAEVLHEQRSYKGETINQGVSNWFMRHGAKVEPRGIGWVISF